MSQFVRKAERQSMVGTPTSYTQAQSLDERLVENNISSTTESIIPQVMTGRKNERCFCSNNKVGKPLRKAFDPDGERKIRFAAAKPRADFRICLQ